MTRWLVSAALILSVFAAHATGQSKESLVGSWKAVSITLTSEKGEVKDYFGPNPMGFLAITSDGGISVIMTSSGRKPLKMPAPSIEERAEAFSTSLAYAGRYTLLGDKVNLRIEVCSVPNFVNTEDTRHIKVDGDRLTMRWYFATEGRAPYYEYIWERLKPETIGK